MFDNVYLDPVAKAEEKKAKNIIKSLYEYYTEMLGAYYNKDEIPQIVTDYISGMTDQYAIRRYLDLFVPAPLAEHANDKKALSDSKLCALLEERNIKIARRTVAKYRAQLNIDSSYTRKL
jgi:hypothetical protein